MIDENDGVPCFASQADALEAIDAAENEDQLLAAREALASMENDWTAETLSAEPVLYQGQADDCHFEHGDTRLWLSRTGIADGEPFENTVTIERQVDGRWVSIAKYDGGALIEEATDKFVIEIAPGNAAMNCGGHVAEALRKLAGQLDFQETWEGEGPIRDANGNTVGRFTFHDNN